ncbi:MAG: PQQ-binding-like beta-propeller repeat protein [Candidatus Obscuribacterales bacterium]|nr:PQQ-binding-like beta-propeller repeat protein [Steroidobacteraceae bacterium]
MNLRITMRSMYTVLMFSALTTQVLAQASAQTLPVANHPGKLVFDQACAACHAAPIDVRTPTLAALSAMTVGTLRDAMNEGGKMASMAAGLSDAEKAQVVSYLTAGQSAVAIDWTEKMMCPADKRVVNATKPVSLGFGVNRNQTRSLTASQAGLKATDMKNLEIAWAIGFPGQGSGTGVSIVGDTMFVTGGGRLAALDTKSGCAKWSQLVNSRNTPTFGEIESRKVIALSAGRDVLVVDAKTGEKIWQVNGQSDGNPGSIRGGVIIYKDKIIVPISASGVGAGGRATFECCVGHGAVIALSAKDGAKLWEYHTMLNAEYTGKVSSTGVKQRGPSGAPIWSMPLIDEKRNRVIVTTGENTSHPGTDTSDAVIALDLNTGKVVWNFQAMEMDVWNMACAATKETSGPNCPWNIEGDTGAGRDFDFGAGAILAKGAGGKDVVLAGQKSGDIWALDADTGKKLWNIRFGEGTPLGGVHWGIATDRQRVFAAINDPIYGAVKARPGVFAVNIKTGKEVWGYDAKPNCDGDRGKLVTSCASKYGFSAAPLTVDGAVIAATLGGEVMIFDGKTGALLKTLDTIGPKQTINGIAAKGGSIDSHAISAGAGMVFINSGYGSFNQTPGNVLIAYRPKKK